MRVLLQFSSAVQSCLTLCDPMDCSTPGLPVHHQLPDLLKLMSTESVVPPNHLILLSPSPPTFNLSSTGVFSNESALWSCGQRIRVSASTSVHPMNIQNWFPLEWTRSPLEKGTANHFSILALRTHGPYEQNEFSFSLALLPHYWFLPGNFLIFRRLQSFCSC